MLLKLQTNLTPKDTKYKIITDSIKPTMAPNILLGKPNNKIIINDLLNQLAYKLF